MLNRVDLLIRSSR